MKIPRSAIHFLVALEAVVMVAVLVLCIIHPWAAKPKKDLGISNTQMTDENGRDESTENVIGSVETLQEVEVVFSEEVLAKVDEMTLEQKVAQLFIITPETLTDMQQVTVAGDATKNAIDTYPVGGLVYSADNFQGKTQTRNMLKGVQEYYKTQFGTPVFLMIAEAGGEEGSPLASKNRYTVETAPAEIGASGETQKAIDTAKNIATYLKDAGFNMNLAPDVKAYSEDTSVSSMMIAETISTYGENGIKTAMSTFAAEDMSASESELLVYKAGIDAHTDAIMLNGITDRMVTYFRADMQYGGILVVEGVGADDVTAAILAGADMIYCPENFKEAYQNVLDAVNAGEISEEVLETAVARILMCKSDLGSE